MAGRLIGGLNALTSFAIGSTYLPCLKVIGFDSELKHGSCFRIMFHLGISDLLLALIQLVFGVLSLTGTAGDVPQGPIPATNCELPLARCGLTTVIVHQAWVEFRINCRVAALAGSCWFSSTTLLLLLSLNRLAVITNRMTSIFSQTGTTILIIVAWAYSAGWLVALEMDSVGYCYYPSTYTFYFGLNTPLSELAKTIDWVHNQLTLWPSVICYVVAFYIARKERQEVAQGHQELNDSMRDQELKLLKQGACIFGYCFVQAQYWHVAPVLFAKGFTYAFAFGNWVWLSNAGINPVVYLGMNSTIYTKVMEGFSRGGSTITNSVKPLSSKSGKPNPKPKQHGNDGAVIEDMEEIQNDPV